MSPIRKNNSLELFLIIFCAILSSRDCMCIYIHFVRVLEKFVFFLFIIARHCTRNYCFSCKCDFFSSFASSCYRYRHGCRSLRVFYAINFQESTTRFLSSYVDSTHHKDHVYEYIIIFIFNAFSSSV